MLPLGQGGALALRLLLIVIEDGAEAVVGIVGRGRSRGTQGDDVAGALRADGLLGIGRILIGIIAGNAGAGQGIGSSRRKGAGSRWRAGGSHLHLNRDVKKDIGMGGDAILRIRWIGAQRGRRSGAGAVIGAEIDKVLIGAGAAIRRDLEGGSKRLVIVHLGATAGSQTGTVALLGCGIGLNPETQFDRHAGLPLLIHSVCGWKIEKTFSVWGMVSPCSTRRRIWSICRSACAR